MRRRPGDLLDAHVHARMLALEVRHERLQDFALAAERPELDIGTLAGGGGRVAAGEGEEERHSRS